ncbi:SIS domain-containing protein [Clostridium sp. HCS.1]|uniref:SIS domain-containing protein n=1 Tax=Clostridium sp. HCS.1 TaxID=3238594 RepID=UPI003A0FC6B5
MNLNESIFWKEIHQQSDCIKECLKCNLSIIQEIANDVEKRKIKNIVFAARGSSEHAAQVAKYVFEIYTDIHTSISSPSVVTCYEGNINYSDTMVIGISQSGGAKDIYQVMQKCVNDGGLCISITNEPNCLMSTIGDYKINNCCGIEKSITAGKSYITQLTILISLAAYISKNQDLLHLINELPEIVQESYALENQVNDIIPLFRNSEHLLIFGRGLLYALALESELKIQETSYLDARCYAASDYQHGPIATALPFVPTIFFIADKKTNESIIQLHQRLKKEKNIYSLIITNNHEIANLGDASILIPEKYDGLKAVFVCAVISQMFACLLSISRGYNPDKPTGVSKHTVTI